MAIKIGNAPCSWGVRPTNDPECPTWRTVLKECAETGYKGIELGPLGYMTEVPSSELAEELEKNDLICVGAIIYQPFSDPNKWDMVKNAAERLCKQAAAQDAPNLVLIDAINPRRASTAGRAEEAERMDDAEWAAYRDRVKTIAKMGGEEYGLIPTLHQHVGGFMEFEFDFERLLTEIDGIKLCFDTGHFRYAGYDPVAMLEKHIDHVEYVHFKDINPTVHKQVVAERMDFFQAHGKGVFCRLGDGCVDFRAIRQLLVSRGFDGWGTVEQDADPTVALSPYKDAQRSREFLASIGFN